MDIQQIGYSAISEKMFQSVGAPQQVDVSFTEALKASIQKVDQAQREADRAVTEMVTGQQQSLHQTMIAMEQAELSFQLMMQIRNKIVTAYEEVFRMQL